MILNLPCPQPNCLGHMAQPVASIAPDGQRRQMYSADISEPDAVVVCSNCGYEGPLPEDAKLMLLGAERLPGMA
ncbi:MAG: hypothetical protein Q8R28_11155 [Dehalococcoidia bacterium]|nr:hypothetical protein [Dehalococcoidia bacterium]